jgi:hypothetical protein
LGVTELLEDVDDELDDVVGVGELLDTLEDVEEDVGVGELLETLEDVEDDVVGVGELLDALEDVADELEDVVGVTELLDDDEVVEVEETLEEVEVDPQKYKSSLSEPPQYSPGFPSQGMLHCVSS